MATINAIKSFFMHYDDDYDVDIIIEGAHLILTIEDGSDETPMFCLTCGQISYHGDEE